MSSSSPSSATRWQKGCVCANCLWAVIKSVSRVHPSLPPHLSSHTPPKITFRPRTTCKSILHLQPFYPPNHQSMGFQWLAKLMNGSFMSGKGKKNGKKPEAYFVFKYIRRTGSLCAICGPPGIHGWTGEIDKAKAFEFLPVMISLLSRPRYLSFLLTINHVPCCVLVGWSWNWGKINAKWLASSPTRAQFFAC